MSRPPQPQPSPAHPAGERSADLPTVAVPAQRGARDRLGEVLVRHGLVTPEQLAEALAQQGGAGGRPARHRRIGDLLADRGLIDERRLAAALGEALGIEVVDLGRESVDASVARMLPRAVAERQGILLLGRTVTGALRVAAADPTNVVAFDDVRLHTGILQLVVVVAVESQVRDMLARVWSLAENSSDVATMFDDYDGDAPEDADSVEVGDAPVVRLVQELLAGALRLGASDIHLEPQLDELRVRYRIDGLLRDMAPVPKRVAAAVVSRVKVMSGLDIAERRRPQDGRARFAVDAATLDARISTLPTVHGEKVVVRVLAGAESVPPLRRLGLGDAQREALAAALGQPQGLVLITGPTGSGKTNTLYSAIQHLLRPERNIVTLEDPVEAQLPGISQVQVNERSGLTFARALRSVLRQDPDVVMVGEVRDTETAELALRASLTGHLVLTTLHTNDAVSALTRLVDMGVEPYLVASSLTLAVAQRLVRSPCPGCVEPYRPDDRTLFGLGLREADLAGASPRRGRGCSECGGTGYRGRTALFEVLPVTAAVRRVVLSTPTEEGLRAASRGGGMLTLRASGLLKARTGDTTYEEVLRATRVDASDGAGCRACDRAVADDMVVCPWCGTPVDRGHCGGCARPLDPEWVVCPWCRTSAGA